MAKEQNQQFIEERLRFLRTLSNEELQRIAAGGSAAPQPTQVPVQQQVQAPVQPVQQPQQFAQAPQQVQQPIAAPVQQQVAQPSQEQRLAELDQLSDDELARIAGISPDELSDRKRRKTLGQGAFSNPILDLVGENIVEPVLEAGQFVRDAGTAGLGLFGTGAIQRGAELGGDVTGAIARNVLPLVRPDLAEELGGLTSENVRQSAQNVGGSIEQMAKERGPGFQLAVDIAQAAPTLALAPAKIASGIAGIGQLAATGAGAAGISEFFRPTQGETKEQSLNAAIDNAVKGAGTGAAFGGVLGGVVAGAAPAVRGVAKTLLKGKEIVGKSIAKSAKVNKEAAQDLVDSDIIAGIAQISDRPSVQFVDKFLSTSPGGVGVMKRSADKVFKRINKAADDIGLTKAQSVQEAGEVIRQGGQRFVNKFRDTSNKLYNRFDALMPVGKKFNVSNTTQIAQDLTDEFKTTPGLFSEVQKSSGFKRLENFIGDAKNGELDFKSIKRYRTLIGNELTKPHLLPGQDERLLRRMYTGLTTDMEAAAGSQGADALRAFNRANTFYKQGAEKIDTTLQNLLNKNTPEQIFQAATSGTKIGGTRVSSIMKTLNPEESEIVRGSFLKKLGGGEEFNPVRMLNQWAKLSPEAKGAILPNKGGTQGMSVAMERLSRFSDRLKDVDRFANTSKTALHTQLGALIMTVLIDPTIAAGTLVGTNLASRLMTNEKFVKFLAEIATGKQVTAGKFINKLEKLGDIAEQNTELANDVGKFMVIFNAALDSNPGLRKVANQ